MNSLIGLFTTILNVLAMQGGNLSVTAKVTVAVTSVCGGVMLVMSVVYNYLLDKLITDEDRKVAQHGWPAGHIAASTAPA